MKKSICVLTLLLAGGIVAGFAAPEDNFRAGGMEFGGELSITYQPSYAIFNAEEKELDAGEYSLFVEGSVAIGWFLIDRLSLDLIPSLWMYKRRSFDMMGEDKSTDLWLGMDVGANYYLLPLRSLALSLGLNAGFLIEPGIDYISNDAKVTDDSLALWFSLEPNVACYWFLGERLAPYLLLAPELNYRRRIKLSSGDKYTYADNYSIFDDVYLQMRFKVGLKYFLPEASRFQGKRRDWADIWEFD